MASPYDGSDDRVDADGVRIVGSSRPRLDTWLVVGAGAVAVGLALRATSLPPVAPPPARAPLRSIQVAADAPRAPVGGAHGAVAARHEVHRREVVARRLARRLLPRTIGPDGKPEIGAADAIAALRAAGVTDGLAAFNPPGTSPPRSGVIVPDGVALPEGYVRHYQTTDDGQALPPILLFHPDYEFFDASGQRIEVPADRVVPPELVPPDIPIEILTLPAEPQTPRP
jgi:hypothetical protein